MGLALGHMCWERGWWLCLECAGVPVVHGGGECGERSMLTSRPLGEHMGVIEAVRRAKFDSGLVKAIRASIGEALGIRV